MRWLIAVLSCRMVKCCSADEQALARLDQSEGMGMRWRAGSSEHPDGFPSSFPMAMHCDHAL